MWLLFALLGYALLAIVFILDKHILTQEVRHPIVYTFYSCVFLLAVGLAWIFVPVEMSSEYWLWSVISGFAFGLALHTMFVAIEKSEASHSGPFIGAITTLSIFAGAYLWLGEILNQKQIWGVLCLGAASLLLAIERTAKKNTTQWHWYVLGIISAILFAVSHLTSKFLYTEFGFVSGLIGSRFMTGVFGLCIVVLPITRKALAKKAPKKAKNPAALVAVDKVLGVVAVLFIQYAISISSVTVVNALSGLQYALMFVIIAILSIGHSKFLKEKFMVWETIAQVSGLVLIILGLYLVV